MFQLHDACRLAVFIGMLDADTPGQTISATMPNGDIVVGMVDGEATVKMLVKAPGYVILKPESKDKSHRPIVVDRDFRLAGKVTYVLKKGAGLLQTLFDEGTD